MYYKQVMLYAVRTPCGEDVIEGEFVGVRTKSGNEYYGILYDVGSEELKVVVVTDSDKEVSIKYSDIESLSPESKDF
ncbi:hypothetical protein OBO34_19460 [Clostridiales Family XIII bacterium ASD5510]|uniref:Uncharacterized protein n=1 Tax=Hominibacterium faecale TaxID=2839743 RepID=A0A9J6QYG0_9FIRM|nr:hypothetical protein [Hominibacterium faecale]MCU7380493.1 hypothetical protein [Hominibacterium faecale]